MLQRTARCTALRSGCHPKCSLPATQPKHRRYVALAYQALHRSGFRPSQNDALCWREPSWDSQSLPQASATIDKNRAQPHRRTCRTYSESTPASRTPRICGSNSAESGKRCVPAGRSLLRLTSVRPGTDSLFVCVCVCVCACVCVCVCMYMCVCADSRG